MSDALTGLQVVLLALSRLFPVIYSQNILLYNNTLFEQTVSNNNIKTLLNEKK